MNPHSPENFDDWMRQVGRDAELTVHETPVETAERILHEADEVLKNEPQSAEEVQAIRAQLEIVLEMGATIPREMHEEAEKLIHDLEVRYPSKSA